MKQTYNAPGQVILVADKEEEWPQSDFVASYQVLIPVACSGVKSKSSEFCSGLFLHFEGCFDLQTKSLVSRECCSRAFSFTFRFSLPGNLVHWLWV